MRAGKYGLAFLLAALAATILQTLPNRASQLHAAPLPPRFEDRAEFKYGGGGVSATGIRGKGGYTVVPLEAVAGCTKLSVSFAVKEDQKRDVSDFRILAVDGNGKRTAARAESKVCPPFPRENTGKFDGEDQRRSASGAEGRGLADRVE